MSWRARVGGSVGVSAQPIQFAGTALGAHRHICGFFDGPEDEYRVTLPFVEEGLQRKELAFHIVDPANRAGYIRRLEQAGLPVAELEKSGRFKLRPGPEPDLRLRGAARDAQGRFLRE